MQGLTLNRLRAGFLALLLGSLLGVAPVLAAAQDDEAITRIDNFIQALVDQDLYSGSVLIAREGEVLLSAGYGMANYDLDVPNTPATKFRISSITKQFTTMSILLLQEQGQLSIQDPICTFIEECPEAWAAITIEQLMTHTSSMTGPTNGGANDPAALFLPQSLGKLVDAIRAIPELE